MRFAALLTVFAIIGGCGLKGDLYLPEEQAPASAPSGTPSGNGSGEQADEDEQS